MPGSDPPEVLASGNILITRLSFTGRYYPSCPGRNFILSLGPLSRPENCICRSPPRSPATAVNARIAAGVISDQCIHIRIPEHEFIQKGAHLCFDARRRCAVVTLHFTMLCHTLPRGGFTRQPVNVAFFEVLTKVRPV